MKIYLLTGVAGFIGHRTAELLLEDGHKVIGVDNMNDYYDVGLKQFRLNLLEKYSDFRFFESDIENYKEMKRIASEYDFDCVLNLAARAGVRYSMENPHVYMSTNAHGCLNMLEICREFKIKKFVLASTSSLYAGHEMPYVETAAVNKPLSPYAATKKSAESMAYSYHHLYGIDVSVVRYFTVYGPYSRPDMAFMRFSRWIDEGAEIELFGDGTQARDFTHVDDIARGTILATKELGYEIINLGGGKNPISINRMIDMISSELDKVARVKHLPFHKADMRETWADISKASRLLGWKPEISFGRGVQHSLMALNEIKEFQLND